MQGGHRPPPLCSLPAALFPQSVFMVLGQSVATAAVMAIESPSSVQDVDLKRLQQRLASDGQLLKWK